MVGFWLQKNDSSQAAVVPSVGAPVHTIHADAAIIGPSAVAAIVEKAPAKTMPSEEERIPTLRVPTEKGRIAPLEVPSEKEGAPTLIVPSAKERGPVFDAGAAQEAKPARPVRSGSTRGNKAPIVAISEPGFLSIDSSPFANIYVDDKSVGDTPLIRLKLSPGVHKIRAVLNTGKEQRRTITITSKQNKSERFHW